MRLVICVFLIFLSLCAAWQLGGLGHGAAANLLVFGVVILGAYYLLSRRMCLALGAVGLVLGLAGPAAVWTYGSLYIKGDPSGYGMLGTLLAYVFIPVGAGLLLIGWRKEG